jgi:microtubule-associated protein-like 5
MIKAEIKEEETENFLITYFSEDHRINISQFLKWCERQEEIFQFQEIIKKDLPLFKQNNQNKYIF